METQERSGKVTSRSQLRALTDAATVEMLDYLVEKFDGDNYALLKTRPDIWPPIDTTESEPLTRLVAAFELEHAAHAAQRGFIRQAREDGRSWYEIGQALDLLWKAVVTKESVSGEAYYYALRCEPYASSKTYMWTCRACQQVITDHGPWPQLPKQEEGHAADCSRWNHRLEHGVATIAIKHYKAGIVVVARICGGYIRTVSRIAAWIVARTASGSLRRRPSVSSASARGIAAENLSASTA